MQVVKLLLNIIFGAMYDMNMTDTCNITIIATGIEEKAKQVGGLGFKSGYITPTSLQGKQPVGTMPGVGLGNFAAPGGGLKQPGVRVDGMAAGQANPAQLKTISGINKTKDIKSSVEEKSLKIPDFLKSK